MQINWLKWVVENKVAANILMWIALLAGSWGIININVTLLPEFEIPIATVITTWQGSSAEENADNVLRPMELALNGIQGLEKMQSYALPNFSLLTLSFQVNTDLNQALEEIKRNITPLSLPEKAEAPIVNRVDYIDPVVSILLEGQNDAEELRNMTDTLEQQLQNQNVAKIETRGLRQEKIKIHLNIEKLQQHKLQIRDIADSLKNMVSTLPAGNIGKDNESVQLKAENIPKNTFEIAEKLLYIKGQTYKLSDLASITREVDEDAVYIEKDGKPIIQMEVFRPTGGDSVSIGQNINTWLQKAQQNLPNGLKLETFREVWTIVYARLNLLFSNALSGLVLVIIILALFLGWRLSFWVVIGIPIAIILSIFVLKLSGRTFNVMSSFAFILALGIIVDDAIVVGEETASQKNNPESSGSQAAYWGAKKMLLPVLASSSTTVAALIPLLTISGTWGAFMLDIPLVIIAVIIASLFECFLILPGHLAHMKQTKPGLIRKKINAIGLLCAEKGFKPLIKFALNYRSTVITAVISFIAIAIVLLVSQHVPFEFYGGFDSEEIVINVEFNKDATLQEKKSFMQKLEQSIEVADQQLPSPLIKNHLVFYNYKQGNPQEQIQNPYPERYAALIIELTARDSRTISNENLIDAWRSTMPETPQSVANIEIKSVSQGPERSDLRYVVSGNNMQNLKASASALKEQLANYQGVYSINDDLPYGTDQTSFKPNIFGLNLGLTQEQLGFQLSMLLNTQKLTSLYEPLQAIDIDLGLSKEEKNRRAQLQALPIWIGQMSYPLSSIAEFETQESFDLLIRENGQNIINITGMVDLSQNNVQAIDEQIWQTQIPKIEQQYQVKFKKSQETQNQERVLNEMQMGAIIAMVLIYIILCAIFGSYLWPLAVMIALPLGLVGALFGHWWLGLSVGLFSIFGMFTLSGVVINDAIILLVRFKELKENHGFSITEALIEACGQRLRPVILTSLTTCVGLLPILLNQSATAKYFHTTCATIVFGIGFASLWVLIVIPVFVSLLEDLKAILGHFFIKNY